MKMVDYSKREQIMIIVLSLFMFAAQFYFVSEGLLGEFSIFSGVAYYAAGLTFIYGALVFPVWESDIRDGESEKEAWFRHAYPEVHASIEISLKKHES